MMSSVACSRPQANVVELIEEFRVAEKEKLYVVLELVNGGSLQQLADSLPDHILPEALAARFTRMLFTGLAYCHAKGIVHRDIKPSNLMVSVDGILKVSDFGVSEALDKYTDADTCSKSRGSPAFQPPEVASGELLFSGFKVDVWAAGVSLYLLTTGQVPFQGTSLISLFENIARGDYPIPPAIAANTALVALVQGLLRRDETERLGVDEALRSEWLEERDERDERWGEQRRGWVSEVRAQSQGRPSSSMLAAITRMYGDDFHDGASPAPADPAAAAPLVKLAQAGFPPSPPRGVPREVSREVPREVPPREMQREIPPVAAAPHLGSRPATAAAAGLPLVASGRRASGGDSQPSGGDSQRSGSPSTSWGREIGSPSKSTSCSRPSLPRPATVPGSATVPARLGLGAAAADPGKKECTLS